MSNNQVKISKSSQESPAAEKAKFKVPRDLKFLVVEDDELAQLYTSFILEDQGLEVQIAENGQKALEYLAEDGFDCILMDVQMKVLDGVEATKQIRASDAKYRDIPIIALTAYAQEQDRKRFLEAGMDDYISKPVEKEELMQVLQKLFAENENS